LTKVVREAEKDVLVGILYTVLKSKDVVVIYASVMALKRSSRHERVEERKQKKRLVVCFDEKGVCHWNQGRKEAGENDDDDDDRAE
jgi:hypothetical protein